MKLNLKRIVAMILVLAMLIDKSMIACGEEIAKTVSNYEEDEKLADELKTAKILLGGDGINGTSKVTRNEMVTLLVRMLGKEDEAKKEEINVPFKDAAGWALPYVSYAYNNKITKGTSETTFSGFDFIDANQAATFMLRTLGVPDSEYTWEKAFEYMKEKGIVSDDSRIYEDATFNRYALNRLVKETLETNLYGKEETLLQSLINTGAVLQSDVDKTSLNQKAEKILDAKTPAGISGGGASGGGGASSGGGGGGTVTPTPTPSKTLKSISAVKGKVSYEYGEEVTFDDLTVSAIYSDESAVITRDYLTDVDDLDLTKPGEHAVTVSYAEEGKTVTSPVVITVNEPKAEGKIYEIISSNPDGILHQGEEVTLTVKSLDEDFKVNIDALFVYDEKGETFLWGETIYIDGGDESVIKFNAPDTEVNGIKVFLDITINSKHSKKAFTEVETYNIITEEIEGGFFKNLVGRILSIFARKDDDSDDKEYSLNSDVLSIKETDYPLDHYMSHTPANSVMNDVYYGLLYFEDKMDKHEEFDIENPNSLVKHIEIDENVTGISSDTFSGFVNAYDLTLPRTLKKVEEGSFRGLASLVKIDFKGSKKTFLDLVSNYKEINEDLKGVTVSCRDGEISYLDSLSTPLNHFTYKIVEDGKIEITGLKIKGERKIKIEETYKTEDSKTVTVASLADDAFKGENISAIWLPNSVEKIGNTTFAECNHLNYLSIGYGEGKSKLKIDGSENAFSQQYTLFLKEIYFNGTKEEYLSIDHGYEPIFVPIICQDGMMVKYGTTYATLENGTLTVTAGRFGTEDCCGYTRGIGTFFNKDEVTDIIFEEGIETICDGSFANYKNLRNVTFPSTIRNIGQFAFRDCPNLGVINYPDRAYVDPNAFAWSVIDEVRVSAYISGPFISAEKIKKLTITEGKLYPDSIFDCNNIVADSLYIEEGVSGFNSWKLINLEVSEVIVDENNTEYDSKDGALFTEGFGELIYYPTNSYKPEFTIPEETTRVSAGFNTKLWSLNISKNVQFFDIERSNFSNVEIYIDEENEWLDYKDGYIFTKKEKDACYLTENKVRVLDEFEASGITLDDEYVKEFKKVTRYIDIPNDLKGYSYFKRNCMGDNVYIHEGIELNSNIFLYLKDTKVMFFEGTEEALVELITSLKYKLNPNMFIIHIDEKGRYSSICKVASYFTRIRGMVTDKSEDEIIISGETFEITKVNKELFVGDEVEYILDESGRMIYVEAVKFARLSGQVVAVSKASTYTNLSIRLDGTNEKVKFRYYDEFNPYSQDDFLEKQVSFDRYEPLKIHNLKFINDQWETVFVMNEGINSFDEKIYRVYIRDNDERNEYASEVSNLEVGKFYNIKLVHEEIVEAEELNYLCMSFNKEDNIVFKEIQNDKLTLSNGSSFTYAPDVYAMCNNNLDNGKYNKLSFTTIDHLDWYDLEEIEFVKYYIRELVFNDEGNVIVVIYEDKEEDDDDDETNQKQKD